MFKVDTHTAFCFPTIQSALPWQKHILNGILKIKGLYSAEGLHSSAFIIYMSGSGKVKCSLLLPFLANDGSK